jgi:hypothetical protein
MLLMKKNPWLRTIGELGKQPGAEGFGMIAIAAGFVTGAALYMSDGDDGATAVMKAGVEAGLGAAGASAGEAAGRACGPAAVICGPAFAGIGGVAGGWVGGEVNERLESGAFWGWKPYDATDRWLTGIECSFQGDEKRRFVQ